MGDLVSIEERYACACSARASWFMRAAHAPAALALTGLADRTCLVACANDFTAAFLQGFDSTCIRFIDRPCVDEFVRAGRDAGSKDASLVWFVNSIGCLGLRVPDLRALAVAAREEGALLVVDNTVASLFGCRALSLGAHVVLEALDRIAAGSLGCKVVAVSVARDQFKRGGHRADDPAARTALNHLESRLSQSEARTSLLWDASSLDCIAQGLDTVEVRMQRHMDNARAIAEYLSAHPAIPRVDYPGLSAHVDRKVVSSVLMHGAGPAIDFVLPRGERAGEFIRALGAEYRTAPAGGPRTRVSALEGDGGCTVRLFAGTDNPLGVVDDIDRVLRGIV